MSDCYNCQREGELKRCSKCKQAFYCSVECQSQHWSRHKSNCVRSDSSIHQLFEACFDNVFPDNAAFVDYGFLSMAKYYKDFQTHDGYSAEQILLGLFQSIKREVCCFEHREGKWVFNTFGASKKMIVKAYKTNGLDDFLHRYIRNVIDNYGKQSPGYCFMWLKNKLVIGPTQLTLDKMERLTEDKILEMRNEIFLKYYSD